MKKIAAVAVVLLGLPAFLFIFQPSWQLGGLGLVLGMIGISLTPIAVLFALAYSAYKLWTDTPKGPSL